MTRRQISIPNEIDEYLDQKPNASGYIVQLVQDDMAKTSKAVTRDEVLKMIDERLNGKATEDTEVLLSINNFLG